MAEFVNALQMELQTLSNELALVIEEVANVKRQAEESISALEERKEKLQAQTRHIQALLTLQGVMPPAAVAPALQYSGVDAEVVSLADVVYQFLSETGREFHYRQLVETLQGRSIEVPGRDPGINLVAHIHDDPRFVRPKRGVYALREWYPATMKSVGTRKKGAPRKKRRTAGSRSRQSKV